MSTDIDLYCEHAKEKAGLPDNWKAYRWSCMPQDGSEVMYFAISGAVCEAKKTRGKHKGHTNWAKLDRSTDRTVNLSVEDHKLWVSNWEIRTGKCSRCTGAGQVWISIHVTEGTKYKQCPKCSGTGKYTQP